MLKDIDRIDVVVVGGCGHVGLPLAIAFANGGLRSVAYDRDCTAVERVNAGAFPFAEHGGDRELAKALRTGRFVATTDPVSVSRCDAVIVVVGTPVDEHLNPDPTSSWP